MRNFFRLTLMPVLLVFASAAVADTTKVHSVSMWEKVESSPGAEANNDVWVASYVIGGNNRKVTIIVSNVDGLEHLVKMSCRGSSSEVTLRYTGLDSFSSVTKGCSGVAIAGDKHLADWIDPIGGYSQEMVSTLAENGIFINAMRSREWRVLEPGHSVRTRRTKSGNQIEYHVLSRPTGIELRVEIGCSNGSPQPSAYHYYVGWSDRSMHTHCDGVTRESVKHARSYWTDRFDDWPMEMIRYVFANSLEITPELRFRPKLK